MKRIILLVGAPGSGKTTTASRLVEKGFTRLSSDDVREQLYGDAGVLGNTDEVYGVFYDQLRQALTAGASVVIDNANSFAKHRASIINMARESGYEDVALWFFDTALDLCLQRNRKRDRVVPEQVVIDFHRQLCGDDKPTAAEGNLFVITDEKMAEELLAKIQKVEKEPKMSKSG